MRLRAQRFLLFTFAFSSALTFTETLETSAQEENAKPSSKPTGGNLTEAHESAGDEPLPADHGLDKRSAEVFPPTAYREEDELPDIYEPSAKRARLGFTGMRGKKEYSADDCCTRSLRAKLEGALNKRFLTGYNELLGGKRAGLSFHGMRGKKRDYEGEALDAPPPEFLLTSGLMEEAGLGGFVGEGAEEGSEAWSKRSPYAFQGTRGKKDYALDLKRAMGFLGMRGKKATDVWASDYKRAPQTSFFGMKGKKAQSSGFFGMRGKKVSPNAFFGIKGKREPLGYSPQELNQIKESGSTSNRFRRGITWLNNSKKAKNAFFGLRGKKSTPERQDLSFSLPF